VPNDGVLQLRESKEEVPIVVDKREIRDSRNSPLSADFFSPQNARQNNPGVSSKDKH